MKQTLKVNKKPNQNYRFTLPQRSKDEPEVSH